MQPQTTNWVPGLIVLGITFVMAAAWLLFQRRKGALTPPESRDGVLEDLTQRAQSLIDQLRALEAEKHHLGAEQYAAEKSRLEREAAAALRAKDEHLKRKAEGPTEAPPQPPRPTPAPTGWAARNPQLVGALWGACIVLFFGGLGYLLVSSEQERAEGQTATGRVPPGMNAQQQANADPMADSPEMTEARRRLESNPSDVEAAALLSHELIRRQKFEEAEKILQKGLAADPFDVELRVHRGVLRATRGDVLGAEAELTELVDTWPDAQEALIFLGSLALQRGDKAKALEHFERFSVEVPRNMQPPQLTQAIAQLRAEVSGAGGAMVP